jgi:Zn-dependent protease/predicted transcriptional regulator
MVRMGARDAWTLFRVSGIPVRIHFTWIFVAAYLAFLFTREFSALARAAHIQDANVLLAPWVWGVLLTLALFACVLLHELAHIAVARRGGAQVRAVTLMMLGGVSEIGEVDRPRLERRMAAAGPASSLVLAALFYGLFRLSGHAPPDVQFGLFYLAQVNLILGVFNLLPAFPMDGGRIFRSLLVKRFGRLRATQIAATVGKVLAVGLVVVGLFGGGWWLALIGLFIFIGGDAEYRALQGRAALRGLRVADLFSRTLVTVDKSASTADAAARMIEARSGVCVVLDEGRPVGMLTASTLARIPVRQRAAVAVTSLMQRPLLVTSDQELPSVLKMLDEERLEAAVVVEHDQLAGTLSLDDIARGLQLHELSAGRGPA